MVHRGCGGCGHVRPPLQRLTAEQAETVAAVTDEILVVTRAPLRQAANGYKLLC